jgi:virulence factor Mce-like protein
MNRRSRSSIAANPVLVGAVTVLVAVVAVFLSYNANQGLPFVPTYHVKAVVPDAAELVAGNDVNVGGARVGLVENVQAALQNSKPVAVLDLKLEKSLADLPRDTVVVIRQRSNVGLKYVELRPGHAALKIPDGGTLPLSNALPSVDLDDVLSTFDPPTRNALAGVISDLGVAFAGRGTDVNESIAALPAFLSGLEVVSRTLAGPQADVDGFIRGVGAAVATVAPVADDLRQLFGTGATTFAAFNRESKAVGDTIDLSPSTESVATQGFVAVRPLLREATALIHDANPGIRQLPVASRELAAALRASGPALGHAQRLGAPLEQLVSRTRGLSKLPATTGALKRLTDVVNTTTPMLTYINPFQTKCNALGLWFRNVPSIGSEGDALGTWFRFVPVSTPSELLPHPGRSPDLHYNPLPDVGQNGECESGNTVYEPGQQVGPAPGKQPAATELTIPGTLAQNLDYEKAHYGAGG